MAESGRRRSVGDDGGRQLVWVPSQDTPWPHVGGIEEVSESIEEVSEITEEVSESIEEVSESIEEVSESIEEGARALKR